MVRPRVQRQRERRQARREARRSPTPHVLPGAPGRFGLPNAPVVRATSDSLGKASRDPNLIGSGGQIDDFDGSSTRFGDGGVEGVGGGGGGSGSALAGRESVGLADVSRGESVSDVVYGVRRKSKKVRRPRGE